MALERKILEFFSPVPGCAAQPHPAMTIFPLLVHAAKGISPLGQTLSQPETLHMLLKQLQKPFSELSDWPKPMGPTSSAGVNQPEARSEENEENQVTPTKPPLYFRCDPHNLMSTIQQKIQPLLKPGHLFLRGEGETVAQGGVSLQPFPAALGSAALTSKEQAQHLPLLIYSPALNNSLANIYNKAANYGSG